MSWILDELQRLRRGAAALHLVFGRVGVGALAFTAGMLLGATYWIHGGFACLFALMLLGLAVRAHDLGDLPALRDEEPTEYGTFWGSSGMSKAAQRDREEAFLEQQLEALRAQEAQAEFLKRRDETALGKPHPPREL